MASIEGEPRIVTDRTNRRSPSPSFGTARTHQSIFLQDFGTCPPQNRTPTEVTIGPSHSFTEPRPLHDGIAAVNQADERGRRSLDADPTGYQTDIVDESCFHNARPHGLPLETIIEQNSRSTLAGRKSAPHLPSCRSVRKTSATDGNEPDANDDWHKSRKRSKSFSQSDLNNCGQLSLLGPMIVQDGCLLLSSEPESPRRETLRVAESPTTQSSPANPLSSGNVGATAARRKTSSGIREIFQRLWASAQGNTKDASLVQRDVSFGATPVLQDNGEESVNPSGIMETVARFNRGVGVQTCQLYSHGSTEGLIEKFPTTSDLYALPQESSDAKLTYVEDTRRSEIAPLAASHSLRKILAGLTTGMVGGTPSPPKHSSPWQSSGHVDDPFYAAPKTPTLTVRNGLPDSSQRSELTSRYNLPILPPQGYYFAPSETLGTRKSADALSYAASYPSVSSFECATSEGIGKNCCQTSRSSLSTGSQHHQSLSTSSLSSRQHPRVDHEQHLHNYVLPTPSPPTSSTSIIVPSPLRPRTKHRPNFMLFPPNGTHGPSPFVPPPRQWRSVSSMLRLPSSIARGRKPSREKTCPHGKLLPRPDVYTGRKLKTHWWHTPNYPTSGPEDCRKCSAQDVKLRFRQFIRSPCFSQDWDESERLPCAQPIQVRPRIVSRNQAQAARSRARQRLSTIYSANCSDAEPSGLRAVDTCPHRSRDANGRCWRCKRSEVGLRVGSSLGRSCGAVVDGEDDSSRGTRPVQVRVAMRRSSID